MSSRSLTHQIRKSARIVRRFLVVAVLLALVSGASAQQYSITATDVAPAQAIDGQSRAVLRLVVSNLPAGGVPIVRWESVGLRFESAPGVPLGAAPLSALVAGLELYRDANSSGVFEPVGDLLVASAAFLPVAANGSLNFFFDGSEPAALQIASGTSATYFVVVRFTPTASAATPRTLRATHLATGASASTARHAATNALLTMAPAADVPSTIVTVGLNAPPVALGLTPVVAQEPSRPTYIPLYPAFRDTEDNPAALTYTLAGNTNAALFGFVGIDPSTGILTLDQESGAAGQAQLTVRATDTLGKFATTTFSVNVGPLATYSAFASAYFGAGGAGISGVADDPAKSGVINLHKYAFFLNPWKGGDRAGLPGLQRTGNAVVFNHLRPKYATDVLYFYEVSPNMVNWAPAVSGVDYFAETLEQGDGSQRIECLLLGNPAARKFFRTRVQLTSNPPPPGEGFSASGGAPSASGGAPGGNGPPPPPPLPIHSSVVFPSETILPATGDLLYPSSVAAADMNNDGWADVVSISEGDDRVSWYPNSNGTFPTRQVLTGETRGGMSISVADFTGDGLPDIASASQSDSKIAWYRNLGGGNFASQAVISTNATFAVAVTAADIDHDGLTDIISASGYNGASKLAWYKNVGAPTYFIAGQENIILGPGGTALSASGNSPYEIAADNIDQDANGNVDLAVVSFNDSTVAFLRGNGNGTFVRQVLADSQFGANRVELADLDGDGLRDIVTTAIQSGQVTWFKNNGSAPFGPPTTISTGLNGVKGLGIADLNKDSKPDILVATVPVGVASRTAWIENLGSAFGNPATNAQLISTSGSDGTSVAAADFDHNGLTDSVTVWKLSNKISLYLNMGGQFSLTTANTAPSVIYESGRDDVLRLGLANHGSAGEDHAQLTQVSLLFEKAGGVPMTTAEANQLIDRLHLYADTNASGAFELASDTLISTTYHLALTAGKVSISLRYSHPPDVQVAPATTGYFFVVPQLTPDATAQNPNSFRVTHIVEGTDRTAAKEAFSGSILALEPGATNLASGYVAAQANATPTTIGLPNLTVYNPWASSLVPLTTYFNDAEDGPAQLQYAIVQNTNPALFSFTGISQSPGRLSLKYRPGVPGSAVLTVRATDSLGKFVAAGFQVTVGFNFAAWSSLYPGAGSGSVPAATIYAFGLDPLRPGDLGNIPRAFKQGNVVGLRHYKQRWANDLTYSYQISTDLVNWLPAQNGVHFYEFRTQLPNGLDQSDLTLLVNWPRVFLRPRAQ